jgi:ribosomal protein S18 acetylase RimI-like enzyme
MSLETIQKIKQGVNTANLLDHLEDEIEPPKKFGMRFRFQGIIDKNIQQLKLLNKSVFSTDFDDKYYESVLRWGPDFNWLAMYNDISVGAICCRIEEQSLHIKTLAVLRPYRRLGVASKLYEKVSFILKKNPDIKRVYTYVPVNNDAACRFYEKLGFQREEKRTTSEANNIPPNNTILYSLEIKHDH